MLVVLMLACLHDGGEESGGTGGGPGFSVLAADIGGGALLSATDDGDGVLFSGGQIGGDEGILARYDGNSLCVERGVADRTLWWVNCDGQGEWYAVGEGGRVVHATPSGRSREDLPTTATLFGVYMDGDVVWAVGGSVTADGTVGEVWRRADGSWSQVLKDAPGAVFKVWAGWFVGDGVAYHLEDGVLVPVDAGGGHLLTVRGRAEDDVWAVGGLAMPQMVHWDGTSWSEVDTSALGQPLSGVWTAPGAPVAVAGNFGTVGVLQAGAWIQPTTPLTADHLHAAWGWGDELLFAGGNLFSTSEKHGVLLRYGTNTDPIPVTECGATARRARPEPVGEPLLLGLLGQAAAAAPAPASAGAPAGHVPAFSLLDPAGASVTERSLLGAPAVLNVWASWCAPCRAELPALDALSVRMRAEGFHFLAVSVDADSGPARGLASSLHLTLPLALDPMGSLVGQLAPAALPVTWVLDAQGGLRYRHDGALGAPDLAAIEAELRALGAEGA